MCTNKVVPLHATKTHRMCTVTVPLILSRSVWSTLYPSHFILGKQLKYTCWVGPTASEAWMVEQTLN